MPVDLLERRGRTRPGPSGARGRPVRRGGGGSSVRRRVEALDGVGRLLLVCPVPKKMTGPAMLCRQRG